MLDPSTVRWVAGGLTAAFVVLMVVTLRWEVGGRSLKLRASARVSRTVGWAWNVAQLATFAYPVFVVVAPDLAYGTVLHFSTPLDTTLQVFGIVIWSVGAVLLVWSSRLLGPIMMTEGVVEGHELVTRGPFATIRHPTYTAFILLAFGVAAIILSYPLLGLAPLSVVFAYHQARGEERLLASQDGFGEEYRDYMEKTGRFLPRIRS